MVHALKIRLFDFLKKRSMERQYLRASVWGRSGENPDVQTALKLVSGKRYNHCLDVGTGLGHYAEGAATFCGHITAIDLSERAVKRARERLAHLTNVEFRVANLRSFAGEQFDLIILGDVLYYLGDVRFPHEFKEVIKGVARLVAPGGRLLMVNYLSPDRDEAQLRSYELLFTQTGMRIEHSSIFTSGKKRWLMSVLVY